MNSNNDYLDKGERMMKKQLRLLAITTLAITGLVSTVLATPPVTSDRMIQVSGIGYWADPGACTDPQGQEATFALTMTGSLSGCHYVFVDVSRCSPGGAYYESGSETFVGTLNGVLGTFTTNYVVTAKFRDCPNLVEELTGRCQHPFADGSGTGAFEGMREARFNMKDDVVAGNFPYKGHILF